MPKEKPNVNIGEVIKSYRGTAAFLKVISNAAPASSVATCRASRTATPFLRSKPSRKIAEAMEISLADFFPGSGRSQDRETRKMLGELSEEEIRFLAEIKKYSTTLSDDDKRLVLAMIRKWPPLPRPHPV